MRGRPGFGCAGGSLDIEVRPAVFIRDSPLARVFRFLGAVCIAGPALQGYSTLTMVDAPAFQALPRAIGRQTCIPAVVHLGDEQALQACSQPQLAKRSVDCA